MLNLQVKINGTDRKDLIDWSTLGIEDNINDIVNTATFAIKTYGTKTASINVNDTIDILDGATKLFSGKVISLDFTYVKKTKTTKVICKDWQIELDRQLVTERYNNITVTAIIQDIITTYCTGITTTNVTCPTNVKSIAFNSVSVSQALQQLAEQVNYSWYIDYNKDVHFFPKSQEAAPFSLSDDSGNFIDDSFSYREDNTQLKNRVTIRGGEKTATVSRSKYWTADGNQANFGTDYKFANLPTVTVAGANKTVGIDNIDTTGFDCYWNYEQKYIRFGTPPTNGQAVVLTGYPLIPIIVLVEDASSISKNGVFEFKKINKSIKTSEEAQQFALAQLDAYANSLRNGGFRTYRAGLFSGQTISVNLAGIGLVESFLIQRVNFRMFGKDTGIWEVEIATQRTMGIINFLQQLLLSSADEIVLNDNEVLEKSYSVSEQIRVTEEITLTTINQVDEQVNVTEDIVVDPFGANTPPDFVLAPYVPTGHSDPKREFLLDGSYLS